MAYCIIHWMHNMGLKFLHEPGTWVQWVQYNRVQFNDCYRKTGIVLCLLMQNCNSIYQDRDTKRHNYRKTMIRSISYKLLMIVYKHPLHKKYYSV